MDFFQQQEKAHRNTHLLVVYFIAGVALMIAAIYLAALLIFTGISHTHGHSRSYAEAEDPGISLWNPHLLLGVAVGTLAVIGLGSIFKTLELAQGGSAVATALGGQLVDTHTTDPDERKLLNVVEEMAIASGVPVPQVYILPEERAINAFAAGHSTSDAAVTVTQGAVRLLTRDELQGVIGHEFSHILNGDMRLNLRLMGVIFGIICLTVIGRVLLQTGSTRSREDRDSRNPLPLLGLVLLVLGWVGVFFGRLIQAAVSRQREFLADASSVQFTRNPAGLSGALQKIGRFSFGSRLETPQAEQASHMFFSNGISAPLFGMLATHPPIGDRIRAIDPSWDGKFPPLKPEEFEMAQRAATADLEREEAEPSLLETIMEDAQPAFLSQPSPPSAARTPTHAASWSGRRPPPIPPHAVVAAVGAPNTTHLRYAEELRGAIPESLRTEVRDPLGASTLIYALLLSEDEQARNKQLQELSSVTSPAIVQETLRVLPQAESLASRAKLPLVDLAMPGLRHLSQAQFQQFRTAVQKLVESDGEVDLFEYVLQKIVMRHLEPHFTQARKPIVQYYALKPLADDCAILLSALAYVGQSEPDKIQAAFSQGALVLSKAAQTTFNLVPEDKCDLSQVDAALNHLTQAVPQIKKNVLAACAQTVAADGVIQEMEAEMLRAIADALDCPLPPLVEEVGGGME